MLCACLEVVEAGVLANVQSAKAKTLSISACFMGSVTWRKSRASEPVLLLAAAERLWPVMELLLPCRACEAADAFWFDMLFVLVVGGMFVGRECGGSARRTFHEKTMSSLPATTVKADCFLLRKRESRLQEKGVFQGKGKTPGRA